MDGIIKSDNVFFEASTAGADHHIDIEMFPQVLADLGCLECQFAGGHQDERLNLRCFGIDVLEDRNNVGCGLAGAVLRAGEDVSACQSNRNRFLLNRGGLLESSFEYAHEQFTLDVEFLEVEAFCFRDILDAG